MSPSPSLLHPSLMTSKDSALAISSKDKTSPIQHTNTKMLKEHGNINPSYLMYDVATGDSPPSGGLKGSKFKN